MDNIRTEHDGGITNIAIGMSIDGVNDYAQNLHATVNTSSRIRE